MMAGTSPSVTIGAIANLFVSASRALYDAIGPALRHKVSNAVIRIREVYDGLLKTLRFGVHNVSHCQNYIGNQWWSQGNYCPNLGRLTRKYRCLGGIPSAVKLLTVKVRCRLTRKRSWSESNREAEHMLVPNDLAFEQV